jgi:hypothetical protein
MREAIDTKQPGLVEEEVKSDYRAMFPQGNMEFITRIFGWFREWFDGRYKDYQSIDAHYHDMEHTLQGELCMTRLLRAYYAHGHTPALTQRTYELGMLAMLLHDTGYLKKRGDKDGTGAKYTLTHVDRSIEFAGEVMLNNDFPVEEILAVQNMIRCTGVNVKLDTIQFQSPLERVVGFALGTADLLGQMAAPDYVEKLPILYSEFAEAAAYGESKMRLGGFFSSADDLMQKTPMFWEKYVQQKINREFLGLYRFLNDPYPDGPNWYIDQIEANMMRLHRDLANRSKR